MSTTGVFILFVLVFALGGLITRLMFPKLVFETKEVEVIKEKEVIKEVPVEKLRVVQNLPKKVLNENHEWGSAKEYIEYDLIVPGGNQSHPVCHMFTPHVLKDARKRAAKNQDEPRESFKKKKRGPYKKRNVQKDS